MAGILQGLVFQVTERSTSFSRDRFMNGCADGHDNNFHVASRFVDGHARNFAQFVDRSS